MHRPNEIAILLTAGGIAILTAALAPTYIAYIVVWASFAAASAACFRFVTLIGEFNVAQAAFYAIGAYSAAVCTVWFGAPLIIALVAGGLVSFLLATVFGFLTMHIKGAYFILVGFTFSEVVRIVLSLSPSLGGSSGMVGIVAKGVPSGWLSLVSTMVCFLVIVALAVVERSRLGRIFSAIVNGDNVAESVGINVTFYKVLCFAIASAAVGIGGGMFAHSNLVISPADFTFLVPILALAAVKIGGERSFLGPVIGAVFLSIIDEYLSDYGHFKVMLFGAVIVGGTLIFPDGLYGALSRLRQLPSRPKTTHEELAS